MEAEIAACAGSCTRKAPAFVLVYFIELRAATLFYFPFISKRRRFYFALLKYSVLGFAFPASGTSLHSPEPLLQP